MDKGSFASLFNAAVQRALEQADLAWAKDDVIVEFHGLSSPPGPIPKSKAIDLLWISPDRFYFIVDLGVITEGKSPTAMFVRPSGHEPIPFAETWNVADLGPFRVVGPIPRERTSLRSEKGR